jgi:small subunit ribosomal protein S17
MAEAGGKRKTLVGNVISDKMDKTVVVVIERLKKHPLYGKYIKRRVKYFAHDEKNVTKPGDKVVIVETRPLSKHKRWRIKEVLEKAR